MSDSATPDRTLEHGEMESAKNRGSGGDDENPVVSSPQTPTVAYDPVLQPQESGGPPGPEPTRYGDWEKNGRCIDF